MSLREALTRTRWLTFALLAAAGWTLFKAIDVVGSMQSVWTAPEPGQTAAAGVVGLLVLVATLALLVTLLGEAAESAPAPEAWPPE